MGRGISTWFVLSHCQRIHSPTPYCRHDADISGGVMELKPPQQWSTQTHHSPCCSVQSRQTMWWYLLSLSRIRLVSKQDFPNNQFEHAEVHWRFWRISLFCAVKTQIVPTIAQLQSQGDAHWKGCLGSSFPHIETAEVLCWIHWRLHSAPWHKTAVNPL